MGLRWEEADGLRVRDIDLVRRRVNVGVDAVEGGGAIVVDTSKTHKNRSVALPAWAGNCRNALMDATRKLLCFWVSAVIIFVALPGAIALGLRPHHPRRVLTL